MGPASDTQISHTQRLWLYVLSGGVMFFLIFPIFIVIPLSFSDASFLEFPPKKWSFRWYENFFGTLEWRNATWVSFRTALFTTLLSVPMGTAAAYGLHLSKFRLNILIHVVILSPLMVPVILIAIGAFYVYAKLGMVYTMAGLVIAHTMLAIPFVVVIVGAGLKSYDMNQEMVARSLGAPRFKAFMTVTLPQIRFSVLSSGLFAFITSLDEVVIALFISGGDNATLTKRMFTSLRDQLDPTIAAISTILIVVAITLALLVQAFSGRRSS
jgi:putative spermidine/putrescine transport system permease protein